MHLGIVEVSSEREMLWTPPAEAIDSAMHSEAFCAIHGFSLRESLTVRYSLVTMATTRAKIRHHSTCLALVWLAECPLNVSSPGSTYSKRGHFCAPSAGLREGLSEKVLCKSLSHAKPRPTSVWTRSHDAREKFTVVFARTFTRCRSFCRLGTASGPPR